MYLAYIYEADNGCPTAVIGISEIKKIEIKIGKEKKGDLQKTKHKINSNQPINIVPALHRAIAY